MDRDLMTKMINSGELKQGVTVYVRKHASFHFDEAIIQDCDAKEFPLLLIKYIDSSLVGVAYHDQVRLEKGKKRKLKI